MKQSSKLQWVGVLLLVAIMCVGCAVDTENPEIDIEGKADVMSALGECENAFVQREHEATLEFEAPWDFEFCSNAQGLNLTNLHWMAFFAAAEYSHAGYIMPQLDTLGFGTPALYHEDLNGDEWRGPETEYLYDCVDSLYWFRCMEERVETADLWSVATDWPHICSHQYYKNIEEQPAGLAASFEEWFVQDAHRDWTIQFFSGGGFSESLIEFSEGSTQMMWAEHGERPLVILAFRGTEPGSWDDILVDAALFQEDFGDWGEVHNGFMGAFESVLDDRIEERLQFLASYAIEVDIWITGHSLGGALATLMTAWILQRMETDPSWENIGLRGLVTFGSPRVGDGDFVYSFNQAIAERGVNVSRMVHGDDTVTNIPKDWPWIGLGYEHVGTTVYLGQEDDQDCCPPDNPDCCAEGLGVCPGPCLVYSPEHLDMDDVIGSPSDHSMTNYYERVIAMYNDQSMQQFIDCE